LLMNGHIGLSVGVLGLAMVATAPAERGPAELSDERLWLLRRRSASGFGGGGASGGSGLAWR
jgi:hypothetical protein